MRIAVIGGRLQGIEATYLAHKAGWEVIVIDKDAMAPAKGLSDLFYCFDVREGREFFKKLKNLVLIVPALENKEALSFLHRMAKEENLPLALDPTAYAISSSKIESNRLFAEMKLPRPLPCLSGCFPLIAKPSEASGSQGVQRITDPESLRSFMNRSAAGEAWVIEEFLEGPSYSIEVIGHEGKYQTFQVTDLEMDAGYDCKRVRAPSVLSFPEIKRFEDIASAIARRLNLRGIMDVEVILHDQSLKVLEIDARLPSQTPTVVYLSTGINMVEILGNVFGLDVKSSLTSYRSSPSAERGVVYEHIQVSPGRLEISGEHIMTGGGPLTLHSDFFGADEAITNYHPGRQDWIATLMVVGSTREEAWEKRCHVIGEIRRHGAIGTYLDPVPIAS